MYIDIDSKKDEFEKNEIQNLPDFQLQLRKRVTHVRKMPTFERWGGDVKLVDLEKYGRKDIWLQILALIQTRTSHLKLARLVFASTIWYM